MQLLLEPDFPQMSKTSFDKPLYIFLLGLWKKSANGPLEILIQRTWPRKSDVSTKMWTAYFISQLSDTWKLRKIKFDGEAVLRTIQIIMKNYHWVNKIN